jgi:hypothetical protein
MLAPQAFARQQRPVTEDEATGEDIPDPVDFFPLSWTLWHAKSPKGARERPDPGGGAEQARCGWRDWLPRPVNMGAGIHAADQRAPSHRCNPGRSTLSAPPKMILS